MARSRPLGNEIEISSSGTPSSGEVGLASVENEIEARFLVPKASLSATAKLDKVIRLKQFYISAEKRPAALKRLLQLQPNIAALLELEVNTFRLREQHSKFNGKTCYFAQLKTKRKSLSRKEVSIPLSSKQFRELLDFADEGYVAKNRIIKSAFFSNGGKRVKIEAHIDQILALGLGKDRIEGQALPGFLERYAIVEIELPNEGCYQVLKKESWGSFNFIETGFNLQDIREQLGSKISFRSLSKGRATKGKLQKVVENIEKTFGPKEA